MDRTFIEALYQAHQACAECPAPERVSQFFKDILGTMFPDVQKFSFRTVREFELHMHRLQLQLEQILYRNADSQEVDSEAVAAAFFHELPQLRQAIVQDADAMFEGDPAAKSITEVMRTYPGFYAISAYRVAHRLYQLHVPLIPRMITEHAHSLTGIDIHPGAQIGDYFCIDHGTGVVIGETTVIGNHVKVYQGVTLGALSVSKEDANAKRHPTIEDHAVIYAGATILGGSTTVGAHSVIGGNVWLTRSVPAHSKLYYQAKMHNPDTDQVDTVVFREHA